MRYIKYISFFILSLLAIKSNAQGVSMFGASRAQDTSKTRGQIVAPVLATSDTNQVIGVTASGHFVLRSKGGGASIDTSLFLKKTDTSRSGIVATYYYLDSAYVPYEGAIANVNLDTFGIATKYVDFNISDTVTIPHQIGRLHYDPADQTLSVPLSAQSSLQIGQEQFIRVVNKTGVQINNGEVVYISGAQGNRPTATLAQADSIATSYVIGVATEDIINNQEGLVTTTGIVRGVNTTAYLAGDKLYLSATTAGGLTKTIPNSPNSVILVGYALNSTVNGSIIVEPFIHMSNDSNLTLVSSEVPPTQSAVKKYADKRDKDSSTSIRNYVLSNFWARGGNAFGTASAIGLTGANRLDIMTNNLNRLQIFSSGRVAVNANGVERSYQFDVVGTAHFETTTFDNADNDLVRVDGLNNSYIDITAGGTATTNGYAGIRLYGTRAGGSKWFIGRGGTNETFIGVAGDLYVRHQTTGDIPFVIKDANRYIGVNKKSPTARLHVYNSTGHSQVVFETSYTPTSTADANGSTGAWAWDSNYIYVKTAAGWKRAALSTW